jgi:hypothetical protein
MAAGRRPMRRTCRAPTIPIRGKCSPLASNTNYDPMSTPGIGTQLQALQDSITGSVNGQFAAAGRDMSGMNSKALGTGLVERHWLRF